MRRIVFFLTSILLIINFQSRASVSLNSFAIQSQFTSGNKIYSPNGVTFSADFSFLRTNSDGNPIEVKLVYKEGNTETVISSSSVSKTSWGSELSWASSISGTLSQNQINGYVYLKYTVYNLSGGVIGDYPSTISYYITKTPSVTGPGNPPPYITPAPGTIPLYIYSQTSGGHFYDTEWQGHSSDISNGEKRNFERILGFVFKQQLPGTVMLYRKASYDRYGVTGDWYLTTSDANVPGYGYTIGMGYVYENATAQTSPVYQFSKTNDHYYLVGQNSLNEYALDGFAFNIIPVITPTEILYPFPSNYSARQFNYTSSNNAATYTSIQMNNQSPILQSGQSLYSPNNLYRLSLQTDGNLVLYKKNGDGSETGIWNTQTNGRPAGNLYFQTDGNLVIYGVNNSPSNPAPGIWASNINNTSGPSAGYNDVAVNSRPYLALQNDGNLVIYWPAYRNDIRTKVNVIFAATDTAGGATSTHSGNLNSFVNSDSHAGNFYVSHF